MWTHQQLITKEFFYDCIYIARKKIKSLHELIILLISVYKSSLNFFTIICTHLFMNLACKMKFNVGIIGAFRI